MLHVNDGDGVGRWVRCGEGQPIDSYLDGTAGSLLKMLRRALKVTAERPRLTHSSAVLAPNIAGCTAMTPATVDDDATPERGGARYAGSRVIRCEDTGQAVLIVYAPAP